MHSFHSSVAERGWGGGGGWKLGLMRVGVEGIEGSGPIYSSQVDFGSLHIKESAALPDG